MDDTLCIGDIVCLYSEEINGFVLSFQTSSVHSEIAVARGQDRVRPQVPDQQVIAFEICVANRYKLNKKYLKSETQSKEDPDNIALKNNVSQNKITADLESEDNALEQKRQQGRKVLYGQVIQLRHLFSDKYVHVSTTKTSNTESNNMAVELRSENAKHCQFRIMPRYKVKSEGDVVQVDDQIVLESFKSSGQYLHVSRPPLPKTSVYSHCCELNLSVVQSGFTIYRKHKPGPDDDKKIKVSDMLRFYHKEMEAYLVAEGLFDDEIVEDVHLRVRTVDQNNPKTLFPSSSAVTYWQIELQEGPIAGGVLKWEQQCKIIHMCTRKYLMVDTQGKVTLTVNHLDPRTVFRLHAVIRDSNDIPFESYCRIEHVVSGFWLHADAADHKSSNQPSIEDEKSDTMSGLKYSTAQLKQIVAIKEKQYDDAFTVQSVDGSLCNIFNYMAGMVPCIQKLVNDKKDGLVLNAKSTHEVTMALQEMREFMIVNSEPSKNRQKLMRNLRIVDLLVHLLRIPCRGAPDQMHLTKIFVEAYAVLYTYLMGNSRKNELYIAKYIDFFLTQFEYKEGKIGLNAAHMVMELIRDNRKIVDRISHQHIDKFVERLRNDKNYRYLDLLSVLCVCDGVSIADNQKYITEAWLMRGNKSLDHVNITAVGHVNCVYLTDLGQKIGKKAGVVYVSTNGGRLWKELQEFAKNSQGETNEEYLFLEHQLELFRMLCHGQNEFSVKVITTELDYLTWDEAFSCLSDTSLPDRLRAQYCDLIITLFVDIGSNISVVDRVCLSYNYDKISNDEARIDQSDSPTYKYFPQLRDWIANFLGTNGDMTASEIGNNMLVQQVLRLVYYLVMYGFYNQTDDIRKLLSPLISLLDGRNDKPYPNIKGQEVKEVLKYFHEVARYQKSPETKAIVDAKLQALDVLNLFFNFIFNLRMEKLMVLFKNTHDQASKPNMSPPELGLLLFETFDIENNYSVSKSASRVLNNIFDETEFFRNYEVTQILLDLSHYDYDEMICKSMHLLNRFYSFHHKLFSQAIQAQVLITDASADIMKRLSIILPTLRRLATAKLNDEQTKELDKILEELIKMCQLKGEDSECHQMNQKILYNHGVLEDALTILSQAIDIKLLDQYGGLKKIFQKTFKLLQSMTLNNKVVQRRLFDRLDMLLYKEGAPAELADLLTEIFTGNSNTCMKIQSNHVQKIVSLISKHKSAVPQFLNLLNAVVKVEELDLPLKRNQGFVMTYFMQYRSEIAYIIDQDEKDRELVLVSKNSKELDYMISMVDLLATCAEGENRFIESICQTIFKIPDLIGVLNNKLVCDNLKKPFLRFLLWVYMNTASGMIESGAGDLPHDSKMWEFLNSITEKLKEVKLFVENNKEKTKQLLKGPPTKSTHESTEGSDQGKIETERMRGTIHYIFDGVMPFLQIFCRSYYQPDSMFPNESKELSALAKAYEEFLDLVAPLISDERQMKNLVGAMRALITASNAISKNKMEDFFEKYGGNNNHDIQSDARKNYDEYYAAEEEINVNLNIFVVNMELSYGGLNTVEYQIGYPSDKEYAEQGGDEDLPLGLEFQNHLKCFINPNTRNPALRYKLAEKLVMQLKISSNLNNLTEKQRLDQTELDVKCLKLLRGLIHNEIIKLPVDWETNTKANSRQLEVIESVQVAINSYGVVDSVSTHLSSSVDDIVRELLAFMCALLFGGNEAVQNSLFAYFTGTREETFFFAIKNRMQLSALATREKRLLNAQHQAKIDEMIAQTKALQKAMKEGQVPADAFLASHLGSMLSMAKSRSSLKGSSLFKKSNKLGIPQSRMGNGRSPRGSQLLIAPPTLMKNGSALFSDSGKKDIIPFSKKKSSVAPAHEDEVDIKIDQLDEEELAELTSYAVQMTDDLDFKDDGYLELVLRVLGLMCDNQHNGIQNYLREQPDNIKSVNLVAETTKFLSILYSSINNNTISLIIELFDTLVEYTSGNFANQTVVFDNKICDYINHILRSEIYKGCTLEQIYTLKKSIATLIRSLTEENPPVNVEDETTLLQEVYEYLDKASLVNAMITTHKDLQSNNKECKDNEGLLTSVGFMYHHLLCRRIDLHGGTELEEHLKTDDAKAAWTYFSNSSLSIEIIKDDILQKIYFMVKDKNVLREEIKDKFKYEVDRTSPSNKLRDFMEWSSDIIDDIRYQRKINSIPLAKFIVKIWPYLNVIALLLSVIIAVMILITWKASAVVSDAVPDTSAYPFTTEATYILGGMHNLVSLLMFISYLLSNHPILPHWTDFTAMFKRKKEGDVDKKKSESHLHVKLFSFTTFYYLTFLIFSVAGTVFHGYFFSFHLLHMAKLNQLLIRVTQAVTRNGLSLILVGLMGLAIIYIHALAAFAFFRDLLDSNEGRQCDTMFQCFITVIHHGLSDGMYNTFEQMLTGKSFAVSAGVAAYDVIFFIVVTTIGLNIIFGIIVDTFSELRDSKWQIDNDMKSNCFICSRENYDFERQGNGFEHHVKKEHNQWAYLFFFIHLEETRPNDYSALELYVNNLRVRESFEFFPMNRALSLQHEEDSSAKKLETLMSQVDYLVNKMKATEAEKERDKEKQRQKEWEQKHIKRE
ncbi:hypothetical protein SNE40_001061 [Patella caerulea]|uniref:Inositol 1,4,5-trisphosphate receptor n=1 Tax=Patella caerulea TaxID=87958 RepID=A0AAN8Q330_PATCE